MQKSSFCVICYLGVLHSIQCDWSKCLLSVVVWKLSGCSVRAEEDTLFQDSTTSSASIWQPSARLLGPRSVRSSVWDFQCLYKRLFAECWVMNGCILNIHWYLYAMRSLLVTVLTDGPWWSGEAEMHPSTADVATATAPRQ